MPKKKEIPFTFTLNLTSDQIEALYDQLLEKDPETAERIAGKKLIRLLREVHAIVPEVSGEEVEKDVEEAIRVARKKAC